MTYDGGDEHFGKLNIDARGIVRGRLHFDPMGNQGLKTKEDGLDELWGPASPTMLHGRRDWGFRVLLEGGGSWIPRCWDDGI